MQEETRGPALVLAGAGVLALLADVLFHDASWGVNVVCWTLAFGFAGAALSKWLGKPIPFPATVGFGAMMLFALCFSLRESPTLKFANGFALFLLLGAVLVGSRRGPMKHFNLYDFSFGVVGAWFLMSSDFVNLLFKDVKWPSSPRSLTWFRSAATGLVIAAPLVLVFGMLFAVADAAFGAMVSRYLSLNWLDGRSFLQALFLFLFFSVIVGGAYRQILLTQKPPLVEAPSPGARPLLGIVEISVVFVLLDVLFGLFLFIQAQHLFGGVTQIKAVAGLTDAEYARGGFFELATVAALSLATILGFSAVLGEGRRAHRVFALLAGVLTVQTGAVVLSALMRMKLYIDFAGLTEERIYAVAFILWIAASLLWLSVTVLRGRRRGFALGSFVAGLTVVFLLNLLNPDATIARFNLAQSSSHTDLAYLRTLSVDAAPAIASGLPKLPEGQAQSLKASLRKEWHADVDGDWRGLNLSRWWYLTRYRQLL